MQTKLPALSKSCALTPDGDEISIASSPSSSFDGGVSAKMQKFFSDIDNVSEVIYAHAKSLLTAAHPIETDDVLRAKSLLESASLLGHVGAKFRLGHMLRGGVHGVIPKDVQRAYDLHEECVAHGHTEAMYDLGYMFYHGVGSVIDRDGLRAKELYEAARERGHVMAITGLGVMYEHGVPNVVERNEHRAMVLYKEAARLGEGFAMCNLAFAYERGGLNGGHEVNVMNIELAIEYFKEAARVGNKRALKRLRKIAPEEVRNLEKEKEQMEKQEEEEEEDEETNNNDEDRYYRRMGRFVAPKRKVENIRGDYKRTFESPRSVCLQEPFCLE